MGNLKLKPKICKCCGQEFVPNSSRQQNCDRPIHAVCKICGNEFTKRCSILDTTETCGVSCMAELIKRRRMESSLKTEKVCKFCGKKFHPKSVRDVYCYDRHYKNCVVCSKQFEVFPKKQSYLNETCSKECSYVLSKSKIDTEQMVANLRSTMLARYGVENAINIPGVKDKIRKTTKEKYGVEWYTQTDEYREHVKQTSIEKYGTEHHLASEEIKQKRITTNLERYGTENVFASEIVKKKIKSTMIERYGVDNPSKDSELHRMAVSSSRQSSFESRVCALLEQYGIEYSQHYVLKQGSLIHEFDFYIPKYKILIDCDGRYFHSYISDPDGKHVLDCYDDVRLELIPKDHIFHVIVEGQEEHDIKRLSSILEDLDDGIFDYEGTIFNWCRSIDFPYPNYSDRRLHKDYDSLCKYQYDVYKPTARLGDSIVRQFHKSIYDAHVGDSPSLKQSWLDDNMLKEVIRNRLIYRNDVDPTKILRGFYISKICPKVSIFNPVLARYLTAKYLSNFSTVFDPFSGFSGRLLGVSSLKKSYIGQDLNSKVVEESNEIMKFYDIRNCSVICKDIFDSSGAYECLLTCPPYFKKEIYSVETVFKTCDEWIDECLQRFDCKKYVFVVDKTEKYKDYITEGLQTVSHYAKIGEYVIVIDS